MKALSGTGRQLPSPGTAERRCMSDPCTCSTASGPNRGDFHAAIKRQMKARIHLAPIFTRKLAPMPLQFANPVWIEEDKVDLDYHVQRVMLPAPGTQAQLEDCAGRLHSELLDRSRPLWRLVVIDGLQTGQAAYYIKVHHAVLDGQAGCCWRTRCST